MRDRLIELIKRDNCRNPFTCSPKCTYVISDDCHSERLADLILADGWIRLPCKVGDTIWEVEKDCLNCKHFSDGGYSDFCECVLDDNKNMFECDFDKDCMYKIYPKVFNYSMIDNFGKTVFLSREESEQKLKEGKG